VVAVSFDATTLPHGGVFGAFTNIHEGPSAAAPQPKAHPR